LGNKKEFIGGKELMEENIIISNLNDFIFCPRSIYFHNLYYGLDTSSYHSTYQKKGNIAHKNIDNQKYSSKKSILGSINIYSDELGLIGKIDLLDLEKKELIERKYKIKKIYQGYYLQIYAQYYCLIEMGFEVKKIKFYSICDNKSYNVALPTKNEKNLLKSTINQIKNFKLENKFYQNKNKCNKCIYREICDYYDD
jgi:CRISPR-associated exonuclease Cas4